MLMTVEALNHASTYLHSEWTMHEFFAGSGLVAYGLQGMFHPVWANDVSERKAAIYRANFQHSHFVLGDICKIRGNTIPYAHMSWASFPCQDLSLAGSLGGIHGTRSGLVWEWLRILQEMERRPSILLVENVVGLLSSSHGHNYEVLHSALSGLGYKCGAMVVDASLFLPHSRPRVFIIAVEENASIPDNLVSKGPNWLHNKAAILLGKRLEKWIWWSTEKPVHQDMSLHDMMDDEAYVYNEKVLTLIPEKHLEKLQSYENLVTTAYRRTRNGKQCLELRFDGLAGCLRTPEGGSSKQFVVTKYGDHIRARLMSPREAARLMGAPDTYILPNSSTDGYKAMGDAVAVPVAQFIGEKFLVPLAKAVYK